MPRFQTPSVVLVITYHSLIPVVHHYNQLIFSQILDAGLQLCAACVKHVPSVLNTTFAQTQRGSSNKFHSPIPVVHHYNHVPSHKTRTRVCSYVLPVSHILSLRMGRQTPRLHKPSVVLRNKLP